MSKSAAARGFGLDDAVSSVLSAVAMDQVPSFVPCGTEKTAEACGVDPNVARKMAKKYAMYKIAGICSVMRGTWGAAIDEDDMVFVSAAQDMASH